MTALQDINEVIQLLSDAIYRNYYIKADELLDILRSKLILYKAQGFLSEDERKAIDNALDILTASIRCRREGAKKDFEDLLHVLAECNIMVVI